MTECRYNMTTLDLECIGHASEDGDDGKICAALTALMLTLAFDIDEAEANGMIKNKEIEIRSGYYHIRVEPEEEAREQMIFLLGAFANGIYMLSETPKLKEHIKLIVEQDIEG